MLCRPESVLGCLAEHSDFALNENQRDAWIAEIRILHAELRRIEGHLFLEFSIPRMGRRADAVLIVNQAIFVIEFKIGQRHFERSALNQVWDYALDLKNFHQGSHDAAIFPYWLSINREALNPPSFVEIPMVYSIPSRLLRRICGRFCFQPSDRRAGLR